MDKLSSETLVDIKNVKPGLTIYGLNVTFKMCLVLLGLNTNNLEFVSI